MSALTQARLRVAVVVVAPVVVLVTFLYQPYIAHFTGEAAYVDEVAVNTTR